MLVKINRFFSLFVEENYLLFSNTDLSADIVYFEFCDGSIWELNRKENYLKLKSEE